MPRRDSGEFRGFLVILTSLALFLLLNGDIISRATILVVKALGWDTVRRLAGILIPLAIVAADRYHAVRAVHEIEKKVENFINTVIERKNRGEARQIMEKVYRLRNE